MTDCSGFSTASKQALEVKDKEILAVKAAKDEEVNALKKQNGGDGRGLEDQELNDKLHVNNTH